MPGATSPHRCATLGSSGGAGGHRQGQLASQRAPRVAAVSECGKDGVAFSDDAAAMMASPPEGFVFNASAIALSKVSGSSRQTCAMYSSMSGALAGPGAGVAGLGGGEAAEGRAELDGCPEVAGALAMPGAGAAEPGGGDAAGGPAEVDGSGHDSFSRARGPEAAALAELGAGCSRLEAAAGSAPRAQVMSMPFWP